MHTWAFPFFKTEVNKKANFPMRIQTSAPATWSTFGSSYLINQLSLPLSVNRTTKNKVQRKPNLFNYNSKEHNFSSQKNHKFSCTDTLKKQINYHKTK